MKITLLGLALLPASVGYAWTDVPNVRPASLLCQSVPEERTHLRFSLNEFDTGNPSNSFEDARDSELKIGKKQTGYFASNQCDNGYKVTFSTSALGRLARGETRQVGAFLLFHTADVPAIEGVRLTCHSTDANL